VAAGITADINPPRVSFGGGQELRRRSRFEQLFDERRKLIDHAAAAKDAQDRPIASRKSGDL
jgi:hypothetical protein